MLNGTVIVLLLALTSFVTATISLPHGERPLHRRRGWARRTLEERQAGSHGHEDHASHPASGGFSSTSTTTSSQSSSTGSSSSIVAATSSSPNTGEITYYSTGLGACGVTSSDTDRIVALSQELYDLYTTNGNSNDNSLCGKTIHIEYGSSSTDVTVVDRCTGCSTTDLDLSPTAFTDLASEDVGRLYGASWYFTS